jgi:hypothetical protein
MIEGLGQIINSSCNDQAQGESVVKKCVSETMKPVATQRTQIAHLWRWQRICCRLCAIAGQFLGNQVPNTRENMIVIVRHE